MARIYYRENKLSGPPVQNRLVSVSRLDYILNNTDAVDIDMLKSKAGSGWRKWFGHQKNIYKKVQLRRDDLYYKSTEGSFYLPAGIIFFDRYDYNFPSEFYFIAKIDNQLEWRKCRGGKEIVWYQIPDLHQPIQDPENIQKIANTFAELGRIVAKERLVKSTTEQGTITTEKSRLQLNETQIQAYKRLTELCVQNEIDRNKIYAIINTLGNYEVDAHQGSTLNSFMEILDAQQLSFLMQMDWKAGIEDLEWLVSTQLQRQFDRQFELPKPEQYDALATISLDGVFGDFDRALRQNGLQLGFIDTQSDEYVAILHRVDDQKAIQKAVNGIGFNYYEAS